MTPADLAVVVASALAAAAFLWASRAADRFLGRADEP